MSARNYWTPVTAVAAVLTFIAFTLAYWEDIGRGITAFTESDWGQLIILVLRLLLNLTYTAAAFLFIIFVADRLSDWKFTRLDREAQIIALEAVLATLLEVGNARDDRYRTALQRHKERLLGEHTGEELRHAVDLALLRIGD